MSCDRYLRKLFLIGIYMLGVLGIAASGGGGGGGGDDDLEIVIQGGYTYLIGGPLPDGSGNSTIGIEQQGDFRLTTEPDLVGTVICDQVTEVCELQTLDDPSNILLDDLDDILFMGDITATVDSFWIYPSGSDRPSTGRLLISRTGEPDISAQVADCSGSPGVNVLGTTDMTDGCYIWDDFEDLIDQPVNDAVLAAFAWEAIAFIVNQALNTLEVFPLIVDDVFAGGNTFTEVCESYSGNWLGPAPEPGANPGVFTFTKVSSDAFLQTFSDCWFGDSTDGTLLQGIIDYADYIQVIDQLGLLTRIGFGSVTLGDGVDPLDITETTKDINDIVTEPTISLTGKYYIDFN